MMISVVGIVGFMLFGIIAGFFWKEFIQKKDPILFYSGLASTAVALFCGFEIIYRIFSSLLMLAGIIVSVIVVWHIIKTHLEPPE